MLEETSGLQNTAQQATSSYLVYYLGPPVYPVLDLYAKPKQVSVTSC